MSWASSRRTFIFLLLGGVGLIVVAGFLFATLYKTPSCSDGVKNQNEEGVDCGGSCALLCTFSVTPPVILFARDLPITSERTDVIAYVENPNPTIATKDAHYTIELFGERGTVIASREGTVDLPPATRVALFVPQILTTPETIREVFVSFDESSFRWYRVGDVVAPEVKDVQIAGTEESPRVSATLVNNSTLVFRSMKVVATVFDEAGTALAASQTVVPELQAFSEVPVVFTWILPFRGVSARIEVRPVLTLP